MTDRYNILTRIKSDHKGSVYLAEHKAMGIKRIIKECEGASVYRESLKREAYVLGRLSYPYIPTVCDIEEQEISFCIIEEYIEGKNLYDHIRENGIFSRERALYYGIRLAEIIEFLHFGNSFQVCHLDIQPKNIIICGDAVYLVDFGNCKSNMTSEERDGMMATRGFAPPEQYLNSFGRDMEACMKADIFGLGAVLLYMLTGVCADIAKENACRAALDKAGVQGELKVLLENTLSRHTEYRQTNVSILKTRLASISGETCHGTESTEDEPYVISVAGIRAGVGATHTALSLVAALKANGTEAVYEENNDSDMVRDMARLYKDMTYDRGCFTLRGCRLKPMYNENIRLSFDEKVIVRDEGVLTKDRIYGRLLLIVMGADLLGRATAERRRRDMEDCIRTHEGKVFGILVMCSGQAFKEMAAGMSIECCHMPVLSSPFDDMTGKEMPWREILNYFYEEKEETEGCKNEEKRGQALRRGDKKHRYIVGRGR